MQPLPLPAPDPTATDPAGPDARVAWVGIVAVAGVADGQTGVDCGLVGGRYGGDEMPD